MKKKIIIGLAMTASLLYFGISCGKKENASIISESTGTSESVDVAVKPTPPTPETPTFVGFKNNPDQVSILHDKEYKIALMSFYKQALEIKFIFTDGIYDSFINRLDDDTKNKLNNATSKVLNRQSFLPKMNDMTSSTSNFYKFIVTPNSTLTYKDIYYKLSEITNQFIALNNIVDKFINQLNTEGISERQLLLILNGDPSLGFIGFQKIREFFDSVKFTKITENNITISANEHRNLKTLGYSPPELTPAEAKKDSSLVTLEHDKTYKMKLLDAYSILLETNYLVESPYLTVLIEELNTSNKLSVNKNLDSMQLKTNIIRNTRPESTLYQLLVTPNIDKSYREIHFKLSKTISNISNIAASISTLHHTLLQPEKFKILNGTNRDPSKGFVGFNEIYHRFNKINFNKLNQNNKIISANDWQKEVENGYSPN